MNDFDFYDQGMDPQDLLLAACETGKPSKVTQALANGADPNEVDHRGWAALHHLAKGVCERAATQRTILKLLIGAGANLDLMASDHVDQPLATPICVAAQEDKWDLVEAALLRERCPITFARIEQAVLRADAPAIPPVAPGRARL